MRIGIGLIALGIAMVALVACGGASQEVALRATPSDPAAPLPANTPLPAATARPAADPDPAQTAQPAAPAATAVPTATAMTGSVEATYPDAPGIVDSSNLGWPREVETSEGVLSIEGPPQRIHTLSLGHDEIIAALIGPGRFSGIGSFTANATYSNIAAEVGDLKKVKRDAEEVLGLDPDLVIASKFSKADLVDLIKESGVPVARTALESSTTGNIPNILLLGYMLGAEDRALALIGEINRRIALRVGARAAGRRPVPSCRAVHRPVLRHNQCCGRRLDGRRHNRSRWRNQRGGPRRHRRPPGDKRRVDCGDEPRRDPDHAA